MTDLHPLRPLPRLNEPAPAFDTDTTHGRRRLEDYAGRWLVLFSHPADFTPVCTTEFLAFSEAFPRFQECGCELLGLSIDSAYSHLAWIEDIAQKFDVDVPFPIAADVSMRVASAYGMIQPGESDTSAVRAVFVIDPDGVLRAMQYYPMTTGRSVEEVLRLVRALRTSAEHGVATPEAWTPGDAVMAPPPRTIAEARARSVEGLETTAWYFSKRELPDA